MIDSPLGHEETLSDLSVVIAGCEQCEHFELAGCQPRRIRACLRTRAPRQSAFAAFAQPSGDERFRACGTQRPQLIERLARRVLTVRLTQRERRLVWASELLPPRDGCSPLARDLERIRSCRFVGRDVIDDP